MKVDCCTAFAKQLATLRPDYRSVELKRYCELTHGHKGAHVFYYGGKEVPFPKDPDEMRP